MARARQQAPAAEPRVWGYCRVSTAEQTEGVSLDEQQRRIQGRALERRHRDDAA